MEVDINNLVFVIGEINVDCFNFCYGMVIFYSFKYGVCFIKIDFK